MVGRHAIFASCFQPIRLVWYARPAANARRPASRATRRQAATRFRRDKTAPAAGCNQRIRRTWHRRRPRRPHCGGRLPSTFTPAQIVRLIESLAVGWTTATSAFLADTEAGPLHDPHTYREVVVESVRRILT